MASERCASLVWHPAFAFRIVSNLGNERLGTPSNERALNLF